MPFQFPEIDLQSKFILKCGAKGPMIIELLVRRFDWVVRVSGQWHCNLDIDIVKAFDSRIVKHRCGRRQSGGKVLYRDRPADILMNDDPVLHVHAVKNLAATVLAHRHSD
jgi:hypothetical protein